MTADGDKGRSDLTVGADGKVLMRANDEEHRADIDLTRDGIRVKGGDGKEIGSVKVGDKALSVHGAGGHGLGKIEASPDGVKVTAGSGASAKTADKGVVQNVISGIARFLSGLFSGGNAASE